jgi:hypothetical protein
MIIDMELVRALCVISAENDTSLQQNLKETVDQTRPPIHQSRLWSVIPLNANTK